MTSGAHHFPIPEAYFSEVETSCRVLKSSSPTNRLISRALDGIELGALLVAKTSTDPALVEDASARLRKIAAAGDLASLEHGETPEEEWFAQEEDLGNTMWSKMHAAALALLLPLLIPFFTVEGEAFDEAGYQAAFKEAADKVKAELAEKLEPLVRKKVAEVMKLAENRVSPGLLDGMQSVEEVQDALVSSTMDYMNGFVEDRVGPAVARALEQVTSEGAGGGAEAAETISDLATSDILNDLAGSAGGAGNAGEAGGAGGAGAAGDAGDARGAGELAAPETAVDRVGLDAVAQVLRDQFESDWYFNLVANATVSRTYHYGYLKSAQVQGYHYVLFRAVMDSRTSLICRTLNGRRYRVADAVDKYERASRATNEDDLKQAAPWFQRDSSRTIEEDARDYIARSGVPTPPLHAFCRSTLVVM